MKLIKELGFKKLPTLSEFVNGKQQSRISKGTSSTDFDDLYKYALFLNQKPELCMFVPAIKKDGVWVVLEEPKASMENILALEQYKEALDRVLFDGFEVEHENKYSTIVIDAALNVLNFLSDGSVESKYSSDGKINTLEQAVNNGIELTLR